METNNLNPEDIFNKAIEIADSTKRTAYLDQIYKGNEKLRKEVESLLKAHEQAGDFLKTLPIDPNVTLDSSPAHEGPGTKIGHYELLELIGEGGMGMVYLAQQKEPVRRKVVLKIVKLGMDSRQAIARFETERQVLAILDHPNIAHVFDAGTTEMGRPYFVMEYVKGQSITKYCDEKKLNIEQRLRLFEQVCEGIHHAHQKGVIHRDIKPSNILVSMHGDIAVPKIIDFGIAKAVTQPLTNKTFYTFQGQILGTPEYMSPEQVDLAAQDIDTRSDIYSLGVVLYELLTGVLPFEEEYFSRCGFAEIQQTIRELEPVSPSMRLTKLGEKAKTIAASRGTQVVPLARRLHRELEWIPLKAMRKDRCRRYRSVSEMADDVRNYLNGLPLIAGPETTIYRAKKFVQKHAGSVATVGLIAVAIVLGLAVSTTMYFRAEDAHRKEAAARSQAEAAEISANEQRKLAEQRQAEAEAAEITANEQRKLAEQLQKEAEAARDEAKQYAETIETFVPFYDYDNTPIELSYARMGMDISIDSAIAYSLTDFEKNFKGPPLLRAKAYGFFGHLYESMAQFSKASSYFKKALDLRRQELGEGGPLTIVSANNLALVYVKMKRWNDADPLLVNSFQTSRKILGDRNNVTTDSRVCMAKFLQAMGHEGTERYKAGDYEVAMKILVRVDDLWRSVLERPSAEIPELACLAMAQHHLGHITEADALFSRLRDIEDKKDTILEQDEQCLWEAEKILTDNNSVLVGIWDQIEAGQLQQASEKLAQLKTAADSQMEGQMDRLARGLARAYYIMGKHGYLRGSSLQETIRNYKEAVSVDPKFEIALNDLARLQAASTVLDVRDSAKAIENATRACEITEWKNPLYVDTLAAAYAEAGDFDVAIKRQREAITMLSSNEQTIHQAVMEKRLNLYEARQPYRDSVARGMVAWWKFDEVDDQTVRDYSGNDLHGQMKGNPQQKPGIAGSAIEFANKGDYVDCGRSPTFDITDEITVAAWIRIASFARFCENIVARGESSWRLQRFWEDNRLEFACEGTTTEARTISDVIGRTSVNDERWHHVVGTYDGTRLSLYIDGKLDNSELARGKIRLSDQPIYIGQSPDASFRKDRRWNGLTDDVRIYSYGFTAEEVEKLYRETASNINQN